MNKASSKILSLLLAVCLTLGGLAVTPVTASALGTLETHWIEVSEARSLAAEARAAGLIYVRATGESPIGIRAEAAKELSGLRLEYDTMAGRSVKTRVYIGEPEKLTADTLLSGAVKSDRTDAVYALFEKYFSNKIHAIDGFLPRFTMVPFLGRRIRYPACSDRGFRRLRDSGFCEKQRAGYRSSGNYQLPYQGARFYPSGSEKPGNQFPPLRSHRHRDRHFARDRRRHRQCGGIRRCEKQRQTSGALWNRRD